MDQTQIFAHARKVMKELLPFVEDEPNAQVALVALMLVTAKTCKRMELTGVKAVEILAGNIPGMVEMWDQAEAGLENVITVDFREKDGG